MQYSFDYCYSVEAENSSPLENSTPDNGITLPLCSPSEEKQTPSVHDVHDPALYISKKLSDDDKVCFLTSKFTSSQNFKYPVTSLTHLGCKTDHGCGIALQRTKHFARTVFVLQQIKTSQEVLHLLHICPHLCHVDLATGRKQQEKTTILINTC